MHEFNTLHHPKQRSDTATGMKIHNCSCVWIISLFRRMLLKILPGNEHRIHLHVCVHALIHPRRCAVVRNKPNLEKSELALIIRLTLSFAKAQGEDIQHTPQLSVRGGARADMQKPCLCSSFSSPQGLLRGVLSKRGCFLRDPLVFLQTLPTTRVGTALVNKLMKYSQK